MSERRNFDRATRVAITKRATIDGVTYCEMPGCGALIKPGQGEAHHVVMDAMETDKSRKLTKKDGLYLCIPCHDKETHEQRIRLARTLALEAGHLNAKGPSAHGFGKPAKEPRPPLVTAPGQTGLWRRIK